MRDRPPRAAAMSFAPLLDAAPAIPLHAFAAMAAFVLGVVQLAAPKGTLPHRTLGWIWVVLMAVVALSSFWIHQIRLFGPWSPIHLLSIFTPIMLVLAVVAARTHNVRRHRIIMVSTFAGALVLAGLFTFVPGRIIHTVFFGPCGGLQRGLPRGRFWRADFGLPTQRRRPRKCMKKRREKP